jgi:deazaflavin-dependent oxidoreductase (nitroreductase family)
MLNRMPSQQLSQLEANVFGALNQFAEPLIRAGFGNPILWPTGTVVIETVGRKTGRKLNVPLVATRIGEVLVVSTLRRRSQWLRNIAANPEIRFWMGGRAHEATAFVLGSALARLPREDLPPLARFIANALAPYSSLFGAGFAILVPGRLMDCSRRERSYRIPNANSKRGSRG